MRGLQGILQGVLGIGLLRMDQGWQIGIGWRHVFVTLLWQIRLSVAKYPCSSPADIRQDPRALGGFGLGCLKYPGGCLRTTSLWRPPIDFCLTCPAPLKSWPDWPGWRPMVWTMIATWKYWSRGKEKGENSLRIYLARFMIHTRTRCIVIPASPVSYLSEN